MRPLTALTSLVPAGLRPSAFFHRLAAAKTGRVIAGGPFKGLRYADRAVWGAYVPKLTGTYERELHGVVEALINEGARTLVDVGGAEGYYAIGLLHRLRDAKMIVYEQLPEGRESITRLAEQNGVRARLDLRETCTASDLAKLAAETPIDALIMDVEGAEWELLPPATLAALRETFLLLETHDFARPGVTDHLTKLLSPTHLVQRIEQAPRHASEFPWLHALGAVSPGLVERYALNEFRPPENRWLWCTPRARQGRSR